jgi:UTP--glucose-1-phosphate uridylyltransferase
MLPIVDKPLIQYAVDEALAAGARRLVFITGSSKRAIEDHFDTDDALEKLLESQGKHELAEQVRSVLPSYASCIYIRQPAPLGLGHAVLCARPAVGDVPFFVHLADDLIDAEVPCLKQMAARRCPSATPINTASSRSSPVTASSAASAASSRSPSRRWRHRPWRWSAATC